MPDSGEADAGTRTPDPLLTMEVLYQPSYVGLTLASYRRRNGEEGPAQIPGTTGRSSVTGTFPPPSEPVGPNCGVRSILSNVRSWLIVTNPSDDWRRRWSFRTLADPLIRKRGFGSTTTCRPSALRGAPMRNRPVDRRPETLCAAGPSADCRASGRPRRARSSALPQRDGQPTAAYARIARTFSHAGSIVRR